MSTLNSIDASWSDYNKVRDRQIEAVKGLLLERAEEYLASEKYATLIELIDSNVQNVNEDAEIKTIYDKAVAQYRRQVINDAENAFQSSGYEEASRIVNKGLGVLAGDQLLLNEKARYEEMAPTALISLNPFFEYQDPKRTDVTLSDKLGNTYQHCIEYLYGNREYDNGMNAHETYILNYEYSSFKGKIFVPEDRDPTYDYMVEYGDHYLTIYGDGKLLYTSPAMISTHYPEDFNVDVSGVDQLTIEWKGGACTWYNKIGIANAYLYK